MKDLFNISIPYGIIKFKINKKITDSEFFVLVAMIFEIKNNNGIISLKKIAQELELEKHALNKIVSELIKKKILEIKTVKINDTNYIVYSIENLEKEILYCAIENAQKNKIVKELEKIDKFVNELESKLKRRLNKTEKEHLEKKIVQGLGFELMVQITKMKDLETFGHIMMYVDELHKNAVHTKQELKIFLEKEPEKAGLKSTLSQFNWLKNS